MAFAAGSTAMGLLVLLLGCMAVTGSAEEARLHESDRAESRMAHSAEHRAALRDHILSPTSSSWSRAQLRRLFYDASSHGPEATRGSPDLLSHSQLSSFLESAEAARHAISRLDADADGQLTLAEFLELHNNDNASDDSGADATSAPSQVDGVGGNLLEIDYRVERNSRFHHTHEYEEFQLKDGNHLVVRRGSLMDIALVVAPHVELDAITPSIGDNVCKNIGKDGQFFSRVWASKSKWSKNIRLEDGTPGVLVKIEILLSVDAHIGRHDLVIDLGNGHGVHHLGAITILFNPWSRFDQVHMEDEAQLKEYVLNPNGRVWRGTYKLPTSKAWGVHQFEVLDIVLEVLRSANMGSVTDSMNDAVQVSRHLTWLLNDGSFNRGVLSGRWETPYTAGKRPGFWSGSRAILQTWRAQAHQPTRYGQCWVFASLLTTCLRSLGIPARSVTNYMSAHDFAPYDHIIVKAQQESVWNFHVWTEAWLARPLIGIEEPCWNAVDATPQEVDIGKFQTGPAAVPQIAQGVLKDFNSHFVLSEVDAHYWRAKTVEFGSVDAITRAEVNVQTVGRKISTKRPGCNKRGNACREDITSTYKTNARDAAVPLRFRSVGNATEDAVELAAAAEIVPGDADNTVDATLQHFAAQVIPASPRMGERVKLVVHRSPLRLPADIAVSAEVVLDSISYNGDKIREIKSFSIEKCRLTADPAERAEDGCGINAEGWTVEMDVDDYAEALAGSSYVRASVSIVQLPGGAIEGVEVDADWAEYDFERMFEVTPPEVTVSTSPAEIVVGEPFRLHMVVSNPLAEPLTNIVAEYDTPDFDHTSTFGGSILARTTARLITTELMVTEHGEKTIGVSVITDEIGEMSGSVSFVVSPRPPSAYTAGTADKSAASVGEEESEAEEESSDVVPTTGSTSHVVTDKEDWVVAGVLKTNPTAHESKAQDKKRSTSA